MVMIREGPKPGENAPQGFDGLPEGIGPGNPCKCEDPFTLQN
jgi:hypothetical protein